MFTVREAAERLRIGPRSVTKLHYTGMLTARHATPAETAALIAAGRVMSVPHKGILVIEEAEIERYKRVRRLPGRPRTDRRKQVKTFNYEPKKELSATDLRQEATDYAGRAEIYSITIYDNGHPAAERAEALYLPDEGRLGIVWGGDASWADVRDVESGIEMWLNDGDAWLAAN